MFADDKLVGMHSGGFTPFEVDVTHLAGRTFELRVRVSSVQAVMPENRYVWQVSYPQNKEEGPIARGIWQNVWLVAQPLVHVAQWRHVTRLGDGLLDVEAWVANAAEVPFDGQLSMALLPGSRVSAAPDFLRAIQVHVPAHSVRRVAFSRPIGALPLWSHRDPALLPAEFRLTDAAGASIHRHRVRLGLREVCVRGDQLMLNGESVHLLGLSLVRHRISPHLWRRDYLTLYFKTLKKLGFNALRTHACIAPPLVFDVADEVGLLVADQSSIWSSGEPAYWAGGEEFRRNVKGEFDEWIRRDWNHPSVVMWDVENEQLRIDPRELSMVRELVEHVRSLDESRPVVASGSGALGPTDMDHIHCDPRMDVIADHWRAKPDRKPLIAGEWWADASVRGVSCVENGGMGGVGRILHDFSNQKEIDRELGRLYGWAFTAYRARGLAGILSFSPEVFLFDPLFRPLQLLNAPASETEPVAVPRAEAHDHAQMVSVRRPYVNPGWDPELPPVRLNRAFATPLRQSLRPIIVSFEEHAAAVHPGMVKRTLVVVNDTDKKAKVCVRILIGKEVVFAGRFAVLRGGQARRSIRLDIPRRLAGRAVTIKAEIDDGNKSYQVSLGSIKVFPRSSVPLQVRMPVVTTGVPEAVRTCLRRRGVPTREVVRDAPESPCLWIIGEGSDLGRGAVMAFLERGGRIVLLRQDSLPAWLPAVCGFRSSLQVNWQCIRGLGFPTMGRELGGVLWAPLPAQHHPVFRGLPFGKELGPWTANDGRVLDDVYCKNLRGQVPLAGHFIPLVSGKDTDSVAIGELAVGAGRLLLAQLAFAENLAADDPEATALFDRLITYAAEVAASHGALLGDSLFAQKLHAQFPYSGEVRGSEASLRVISDATQIKNLLASVEGNSTHDPVLSRGGHILCIVPPGLYLTDAWAPEPVDTHFITSFTDRPELLTGWNAADLDFWESGSPAGCAWPLEATGSRWRDAIIAFAFRPETPKCGMLLGAQLGSLFKFRRVGRGTVCMTTLNLTRLDEPAVLRRWEAILANAHMAVPADRLHGSAAVPHIEIAASPELPLDGDGKKWASLHTDKNIAPWSRAVPHVLAPATSDGPVEASRLSRRGGVGYLLHSPRCLYAAGIALAPEHVFSDSPCVYNYSVMELFIGPTQICVSQNLRGQPAYYFHGTPLLSPGAAALRSRVTVFDRVPAWPDIDLLPLHNRAGLKACFFELAVPWSVLDVPRPDPNYDFAVALALGFPDVEPKKSLQLVLPATFEFERPATYARARLLTAPGLPVREPHCPTVPMVDGTDRITIYPSGRKVLVRRGKSGSLPRPIVAIATKE